MKIDEFKKIVKWNNDYKGDGLKIAVLELSINMNGISNYTDVINTPTNHDEISHAQKSGKVWKTLMPNAKVYSLDCKSDESAEWILNNDIDIVTLSISDTRISLSKIIEMSNKCFLTTSGGNSGINLETMRDTYGKYWFQVGAVDSNLEHKTYSSWGKDMINGATLTDIEFEEFSYGGTSCSAQLYGCLVAQYYQAHFDFFSKYPNINQVLDFIDRHSHNTQILDPDSDLKMGYGFLVLPEKYHFKKIELRFPEDDNKSYLKALIFKDDNVFSEDILVPAEIIDGRTRMGVRDLANLTGKYIRWNNDKRQVEIFIQQGDH